MPARSIAQAGNPADRERALTSDKDDAGRDVPALPANSMNQSGGQRVGDGYREHYPCRQDAQGDSPAAWIGSPVTHLSDATD